MNNTQELLTKIKAEINKANNTLLTAYHRYDGDAVGCEIAMYWALKKLHKNPLIFNLNMNKELSPFKFIKGFEYIETDLKKLEGKRYDLVITFDSGEFPNIDIIQKAIGTSFVINIDHHKTSSYYGNINWVVPEKAATGELVFELLKFCQIPMDIDIALPLMVAIYTDTGRFAFPSTTQNTFAVASELMAYVQDLSGIYTHLYCNKTVKELKLQAECIERVRFEKGGKIAIISLPKETFEKIQFYPLDFQEYIDLIKSIKGVEVALLLREENNKIRVSIRTNGSIDASELAQKFGGGGHLRASGCTLEESLDSAVNKFLDLLDNNFAY